MRLSRRTLLAAGLTAPLAACATPQRRGAGGPVEITFWSALRGSQQVVDAFNSSQHRIKVIFQQIPSGGQGGYAKLSNAARAGNAPDVATIEYPQVPGYAIDGVARDITDLVTDRVKQKLLPQALKLTTFDNRVFSVPLDIEPMVLHYRADLFEAGGFRIPRTWDEFTELARTVKARFPDKKLVLFPTDGAMQFACFAWQAGAKWFDTGNGKWQVSLADTPTRRVADYWQGLIDEDLVYRNASDSKQHDAQLGQDLILTRLSGAWDAGAQMRARPGQKGKWRIAPMPVWDQPVVGTHGGSTFAVTKDSKEPEAAMEFIEWQTTHPAALTARLKSGTSSQYPVAPGLVETGAKAFPGEYYGGQDIYGLFKQEADKIRDGWVWGPRMTATQKVMQDGFAKAGAGEGTLIDAVKEAQSGTMPDLKALGLSTEEVER
jgi:multiple sugar transport system substrate-binding protein